MRQCHYGKERRCPAAQPHRRRDVWRNGIGPAQQQVEGRNEWHHARYAVEDEKQYRLYRCMPEYIHLVFAILAAKVQKLFVIISNFSVKLANKYRGSLCYL